MYLLRSPVSLLYNLLGMHKLLIGPFILDLLAPDKYKEQGALSDLEVLAA